MEQHLQAKKEKQKKEQKLKHQMRFKKGASLVDRMQQKAITRNKALQAIQDVFKKKAMPQFAIYSRLDKNLLKQMLIKAAEFEEEEIPELRKKYFNPEKEEDEGTCESCSYQVSGRGGPSVTASHDLQGILD